MSAFPFFIIIFFHSFIRADSENHVIIKLSLSSVLTIIRSVINISIIENGMAWKYIFNVAYCLGLTQPMKQIFRSNGFSWGFDYYSTAVLYVCFCPSTGKSEQKKNGATLIMADGVGHDLVDFDG